MAANPTILKRLALFLDETNSETTGNLILDTIAEIQRLSPSNVGVKVGVLERVEAVARDLEYKGKHSRSYGHHAMAYEIASRKLKEALTPSVEQEQTS